jgi:hypothetical protein
MIMTLGAYLPDYDVVQALTDKNAVVPVFDVPMRKMLQTLGTEWGRKEFGPHIWVDIARLMVQRHAETSSADVIVFDDCRFANEVEMIRSLGGTVVRLERPDRAFVVDNHASELSVAEIESDMVVSLDRPPQLIAEQLINRLQLVS